MTLWCALASTLGALSKLCLSKTLSDHISAVSQLTPLTFSQEICDLFIFDEAAECLVLREAAIDLDYSIMSYDG